MENLQISKGLDIDTDTTNSSFYSPGDIIMLSSDTAPDGFLPCDGSTITEELFPALYQVLGTYYDTLATDCKLPNLNQLTWVHPCGTAVGSTSSYGGSSLHTHNSASNTVTAQNASTPAHNHSANSNSNSATINHSHGGWGGGVGANNASNVANRSNGAGQGVNLAVAGHSHSWGYSMGGNAANDNHSHGSGITLASAASSHTHTATLTTNTASSSSYIPDNVISIRYYIKW
jgi:microcystin-dependent protein